MSYEICSNSPKIKPILLIRNPYAVALSKTERKHWGWMNDPKEFLLQKSLRENLIFLNNKLHTSKAKRH